jgi:hypothetical protein
VSLQNTTTSVTCCCSRLLSISSISIWEVALPCHCFTAAFAIYHHGVVFPGCA